VTLHPYIIRSISSPGGGEPLGHLLVCQQDHPVSGKGHAHSLEHSDGLGHVVECFENGGQVERPVSGHRLALTASNLTQASASDALRWAPSTLVASLSQPVTSPTLTSIEVCLICREATSSAHSGHQYSPVKAVPVGGSYGIAEERITVQFRSPTTWGMSFSTALAGFGLQSRCSSRLSYVPAFCQLVADDLLSVKAGGV
jgi:hypothetical protein